MHDTKALVHFWFITLLCIILVRNKEDMTALSVHMKLDSLPDNLQQQVSDFIDFLVEKRLSKTEQVIPIFGSAKGMIRMSDDFDEPLEQFKDYMA